MAEPNDNPETPEAFLKGVGERLNAAEGVDSELASVLALHILVATPHADAVSRAKTAIVAMAERRAQPAETPNA
jgi:hypothetical protein